MNSPNIDEILDKLSTKFNKIFYDREFVCCVNEDFQVVLKNTNKCCVVVFPVLGPNYLKAVRYQAKIFDLAVFALGSGTTRSVAVCQKGFLRKNLTSEVSGSPHVQIMPESVSEISYSKLRKKRPERQLYIPPAQRRLPLNKDEPPQSSEMYQIGRNKVVNKNDIIGANKHVFKGLEINKDKQTSFETDNQEVDDQKCTNTKEKDDICIDYLFTINYIHILWEYRLSKDNYGSQFLRFCDFINYVYFKYYFCCQKVPLYTCQCSSNILYILHKNYVLWQPKLEFIYRKSDSLCANSSAYPLYNFESTNSESSNVQKKKLLFVSDYNLEPTYDEISKYFEKLEFRTLKVLWNENQCLFSENDVIVDLSVINCGHKFIISNKKGDEYFYECRENHSALECYLDKKNMEQYDKNSHSSKFENGEPPVEFNGTKLIKNSIITLEERFEPKSVDNDVSAVQKNNIKNSTPIVNIKTSELINDINTQELMKKPKRSSEHEQEKEIMRKTKELINRKTRPIMKYVDDTADTLRIGKNDNINNWEELFDDDGQLQEELFKEIAHKVGTDVTIVKAKEDYSEYVNKQSEDLEHMVELYDFPSTLGTHDIIQAFSDLNSDAMYVKWVDDTHAILVLGSLTQAQRAVELDNPLIKARPMTAASGMSLATAYKHDLKPAMKRPQTNLQTARRLITTHLGTRSKVSQEQNAKEKNDLKAAREMKKLAKKNEQDAWEGNLRSSIN